MRRAMFFDRLGEDWVRCRLCPHECRIPPSGKGICGVRENRGGELWSLVYGKLVARAVDPIEKKPLFHFLPGSRSYSIATVGCNLRCLNCQNYEISQSPKEGGGIFGEEADPEEVVDEAIIAACDTISYTYTEPTIFFEFAYDVASLAKRRGIRNLFITNGYISEEALREIAPYLDGANVDLKSISDDFYRRICGAKLEPVLKAIRLYKELGIWIEVTTLLIPTLNDGEEELRAIARFIRGIGEEIPWHISQFYPMYKLTNLPRTPTAALLRAREIGLEEGLRYVYTGNVPGLEGENTYCYGCGELLIRRVGFSVLQNKLKGFKCPRCGSEIDGVWS